MDALEQFLKNKKEIRKLAEEFGEDNIDVIFSLYHRALRYFFASDEAVRLSAEEKTRCFPVIGHDFTAHVLMNGGYKSSYSKKPQHLNTTN